MPQEGEMSDQNTDAADTADATCLLYTSDAADE